MVSIEQRTRTKIKFAEVLSYSVGRPLIFKQQDNSNGLIRGQPMLYKKISANSARKLEVICAQCLLVKKNIDDM